MRRGQLRVLNPCHEDYDAMRGDGATRFCNSCEKNVHNLSRMTRREAANFIDEHRGQSVCVRYQCDKNGSLKFKPETVKKVGFVAVLSLAMAACTGYVEGDDLEIPDGVHLCQDAAGYTVPCDEIDEGVIPDENVPDPLPGVDPVPDPDPIPGETEFMGTVAGPEPVEPVIMGDIEVGAGEGETEGCPIRPHEADAEVMGEAPIQVERSMGVVRVPAKPSRAHRREIRRERRAERRRNRRG